VLFPPAVIYANNQRVEPHQDGKMDHWKMENFFRYLEPASVPKWAVFYSRDVEPRTAE